MTVPVSRPVDVGAWIAQREGVRTMRMRRHLVVGGFAGLSLGFLIPAVDSLLELALVFVLISVVFQSLARGVNARFGYLWGWIYPEPLRATALDRFVSRLIASASNPGTPPDELSRVKVLPLDTQDD